MSDLGMLQQLRRLGVCSVENAVGFQQQKSHVAQQSQPYLAVLGVLEFRQRFLKLSNNRRNFILGPVRSGD